MQKIQIVSGRQENERTVVGIDDLNPEIHGELLCYPGTDLTSFGNRVAQMKSLGVEELILQGSSKVGKFGIVGRGCVSTVVKAKMDTENGIVALKIRRVDANRPNMSHDFELQKYANSFGVGPKAIASSKDLFAMEFIDATKLGKWATSLKTRTPKKPTRALIRNVLEQCYLLDANGLDHGELSNPSKHVLLWNGEPRTTIIDYESASRNRRVSNLTAVASFFFLSGAHQAKIPKILSLGEKRFSHKRFIHMLHEYKDRPTQTGLEKILSYVQC